MSDTEPASTFPALFAQVVAANRERDALVVGDATLTYEELDRRTANMASALLAAGMGKGSRIALLAPDGLLWITTFYGALRIGAIVTPLSTLAPARELAHVLRNSDAQLLIGVRGFLRHDYARSLESALPGLSEATAGQLRLPAAPYLRSVWLDDASGLSWARPVDALLALADDEHAPGPELLAAVEREVVPGDDAVVIYTSGSTATPKAVVHRQWTIARHPPVLATYGGLEPADRSMPLLPAFWAGGVTSALQVLATGGTLIYPSSPDTEVVLDTIEKFGVTRVVVWHMRAKLEAAAKARGMSLAGIKGFGVQPRDEHGAVIPPDRRSNQLGMSETFAQHSAEPANQPLPADKAGASGRAVNGIERRVVDPQSGQELAPGLVGELQVRGGALMSGFYKVDRDKVFTRDGFYPTNDLVRIDPDGYAYFIGRTGDMLKTNSANVSRLEVQAALESLDDVELALVAGLPDDELGEIIVAAVVPSVGAPVTETSLRTALRDQLSSFKIPRRIVLIGHGDVPRTTTGKVRLFDLSKLIESRL